MVGDLVEERVDGVVDVLPFGSRGEKFGLAVVVDRVDFFHVQVDCLFLFEFGERVVAVNECTDPAQGSGLRQFLIPVLGDDTRELDSGGLTLILSSSLILSKNFGALS